MVVLQPGREVNTIMPVLVCFRWELNYYRWMCE